MIQTFSPQGVCYLEITCGENERAALDYILHYRSPHMMGIDTDYSMSQAYKSEGWPSFVVVDAAGIIRFHGFDSDRNLSRLRQCVQDLVARQPQQAGSQPLLHEGIALTPEALACRQARREHSPRLAVDNAGNPHLVFWSNAHGTNGVFLRRFNPQGQLQAEERLSPTNSSCYHADCAFGPDNTLWVTWCGKRNGFYDIFVQRRPPGQSAEVQQLSHSLDDAMSPKLAVGTNGTVVVTYYKWRRMGNASRDRDIYARRFDPARQAWSDEVEISPRQPEVEDHSDPDVVVDRRGNAWIVWSFDYHSQLYKHPVDADQPTIFAARLDASGTVTEPVLVGASGKYRYAIDFFPSAALDTPGALWCAWDCSEPSRRICVARLNASGNGFTGACSFGMGKEIGSTPELSPAANGLLLLAWSQRGLAHSWEGRVALLKSGQPIAQTSLAEKADVQFLQAQQGPDGQYWVACELASSQGSQVALRNISRELQPQ